MGEIQAFNAVQVKQTPLCVSVPARLDAAPPWTKQEVGRRIVPRWEHINHSVGFFAFFCDFVVKGPTCKILGKFSSDFFFFIGKKAQHTAHKYIEKVCSQYDRPSIFWTNFVLD